MVRHDVETSFCLYYYFSWIARYGVISAESSEWGDSQTDTQLAKITALPRNYPLDSCALQTVGEQIGGNREVKGIRQLSERQLCDKLFSQLVFAEHHFTQFLMHELFL